MDREELGIALHDRHHALLPLLLIVGGVSNHLEKSNHVLVALRLFPLRRIPYFWVGMVRPFGSFGQAQLATPGPPRVRQQGLSCRRS